MGLLAKVTAINILTTWVVVAIIYRTPLRQMVVGS